MNAQVVVLAPGIFQTLPAGRVMALGEYGGHLEVVRGRVWLTRSGDLDDHVFGRGESFVVPPAGQALVEAWDDESPAVVAWRPGTVVDRLAAAARRVFHRYWDIVDPARRIGAGSVAAAVALVSGALLFGPLSDARSRELAAAVLAPSAITIPVLLHNGAGATARVGLAGDTAPRGEPAHVDAGPRERARRAAQEARRRTAGAA